MWIPTNLPCYLFPATSLLPISSSMPQWSILEPLLFIIYVNSALSVTDARTTVQLYADDMKCYQIINNGADAVQLQRDLLSLTGWSSEHFMKFNANQCISTLSWQRKKILCTHHIFWVGCKLQSFQFRKILAFTFLRVYHGTIILT